jgi:hypothetical protein
MKDHRTALRRPLRLVMALLVAPLVPAVLLRIPAWLHGDARPGTALMLAVLATYAVMLLFGLPAYVLSRRWGWTNVFVYMALGAIIGLMAYTITITTPIAPHTSGVLSALVLMVVYLPIALVGGTIAMTSFWLITRPDRM